MPDKTIANTILPALSLSFDNLAYNKYHKKIIRGYNLIGTNQIYGLFISMEDEKCRNLCKTDFTHV